MTQSGQVAYRWALPLRDDTCIMTKVEMDKKTRKRIQVLQEKLQNRRKRLAAAKQQPDEPAELEQVQREVAAIEAELRQLQGH